MAYGLEMDHKMRDNLVATCLDSLVQRHREGTRLGDSAVARGHWCKERGACLEFCLAQRGMITETSYCVGYVGSWSFPEGTSNTKAL